MGTMAAWVLLLAEEVMKSAGRIKSQNKQEAATPFRAGGLWELIVPALERVILTLQATRNSKGGSMKIFGKHTP